MTKQKLWLLFLSLIALITTSNAQSLPGDSIVFGPMFSPVYNDSVRVWVLTKTNTGSGDAISLEVTAGNAPGTPLQGKVYNSDDRLGYRLRSFVYASLVGGQTYTAVVKKNGTAVRTASIKNETNIIDDFTFLTGGCGRIYDTTRCIDRPESQTHKNGDPVMYNRMAEENSDLMVWLGDATYLLGLQHANGQCPNGVDDWANKDMAFARYMFYRKFHDSLTRAMPQLAITDNHDTGPNEFDKTMPTLGAMKEIFMDWWPNPEYKSTPEGQGLFSSYKYKDVEFFLLDNRSYRDGIQQQLGPEQLQWLKQGLLRSTAAFKVLISGTPVFAKHWGGRNFSVTAQADDLIGFIKANNINGVLAFSADIHEQEFYGRYADGKYPYFDIISGNLNSDVGSGQYSIDYGSDRMLRGVKQTYMRVSVYGNAGDRRMKIAYVGLNGQSYFETIIHSDMLKSVDEDTRKISLQFTGTLKDSSFYDLAIKTGSITYDVDRKGNAQSAAKFTTGTALRYPAVDVNDKAFSIGYWANPSQFLAGNNVVLSNATANTGVSLGFNKDGYPQYTDHKTGTVYTASRNVVINKWTYIVWKYDNVKKQLSLFYNGWPAQSWSNVASPAASAADLVIGSDLNNNHYVGLLDDVVVFGKLISDSRILDNSGYTSHRGSVLKVAGASGMVIPGNLINTALANDFSIEFWAKLNGDPGTNYKILASNGRVNNNTAGISFEYPDNNKLNIVLGTNTSSWNTISDKGNVWNIGEWNHVAVSATKNGTLIYYVNGEKTGEVAFTSYAANTFGLALGYSTYYAGSGVNAEMDELRIWNVALSQDSIRKRMHYSLTGSEAGLQYYYNFEKNSDTSFISKGSAQPYEITLKGGELVSATDPVADIEPAYQATVTGNWSRGNTANKGLGYPDAITVYNSNIVTGKNIDSAYATTKSSDIYYLKGGWQIDPLNNSFATVKISLANALAKADSISKVAGKYYLLQQTAVADSLVIISQGNFDGQNVTFLNVFIEEDVYHLGWQADSTGAIGRGGSLSLPGGHKAYIPYNKVNPVLSGKFTIEMWARLMQDPATSAPLISSHGRVNNNSTGFDFEFTNTNSLNAVFGTNGSSWNTVTSNKTWNIGEWNHVAVTGAPGDSVKLYLNGVLMGKNSFAGYVANTNWNLALGSSINYGGNVVAMMDECRIWNKVKTQQEILDQMHIDNIDADPSLVFRYSFNQADNGYMINTGTGNDSVALTNARIIASTSPVSEMDAAYRHVVTGNWSVKNTSTNGLYVKDVITDYTQNVVIGRDVDNTPVKLGATKDTFYVKGGWLLNALSVKSATLTVDLARVFSNPDSISSFATRYYLLQGDPNTNYTIVASGAAVNNVIEFGNVSLDFGRYYLGWRSSAVPTTATFKVNAGTDDAEQDITAGTMYLTSSDLELTKDGTSDQLLGVRFTGVTIPQGAVITNAYMQFTVDELNTTGDVNLLIGVENTDNPLTMATFDFDIYHRIMNYGDTLIWKPGPFTTVGDAGADQRTPDLKKLLQSIVNRPNWKSGNAVLFTMIDPAATNIPGYTANTAKRVAQAYENNAANAPKLVVTYVVPNRYQNGTFPIAKKSSWKYNDAGNDLSSTGWTATNYNDSSWFFGNGILGYGDGNETTTLNYGNDANNKRTTYYLRNTFTVDDHTKYDSLVFDVLRDDGAVVYVNGTEAFRMNMPAGTVNYNTLATAAVNGSDETTYYRVKTANLLKTGTNVIAVELHQNAAGSSDLSFDMGVGYTLPALQPAAYPLTKGSTWHYLDNGVSLDAEAWKDTTYNDRDWARGEGPLGYGDPMTTTISYGADANNKYVTSYFRRDIMIDTAALPDSVEIGVRRDDGVIIYVNGKEVVRDNMPAGAITYQTFSAATIDGAAESIYYTFKLPKTIFRQGGNQIAAEVHNRSANSSDLGFDCYIKDATKLNPPVVCTGKHIGCFTSIVPTAQTTKMIIPVEHRFQLFFKQGDAYTNGSGTVPGNHDFTAYVPTNGSSVLGRLSVNHENSPGGVSMLKIHYNDTSKLWLVDSSQPVDFYNNNLVTTMRNCSGGITPWGTVITSEESLNGGDVNADGYEDVGWNVEIDPVTAKVLDYDKDGKQDKLWAMGRMNHENVVVLADKKTVYYGEDGGTHCVYKFVADVAGNLSAGKVYVLSLDQPLLNDDPSGSTAKWIQLPNTTQYDRNNMSSIAASLGGTNFNGVEDCEISPLDGKIYFTSKGKNRVYRFSDKGATVENFETFVGGMSYPIYTSSGVYTEAWGDGNDNLTFDDRGNLWVLQDGGNYYIWVVRPDHTQASPKVELFGSMPAGSEPTGLTFSPDYRFGFVSVQHPNSNNVAQQDATLKNVTFNASATIVFALNENLGTQKPVAGFKADTTVIVKGNDVVFTDTSKNYPTARKWFFENGNPATSTKATETVVYTQPGKYKVELIVSNVAGADTIVKTQYITVNDVTAVPDVELDQALKIYPNPTNGWIKVSFKLQAGKKLTLELYDAIGKKLTNLDKLTATGVNQQLDYNIRPFVVNSQVFTIVLRTDDGIVSRRLLYLNK